MENELFISHIYTLDPVLAGHCELWSRQKERKRAISRRKKDTKTSQSVHQISFISQIPTSPNSHTLTQAHLMRLVNLFFCWAACSGSLIREKRMVSRDIIGSLHTSLQTGSNRYRNETTHVRHGYDLTDVPYLNLSTFSFSLSAGTQDLSVTKTHTSEVR